MDIGPSDYDGLALPSTALSVEQMKILIDMGVGLCHRLYLLRHTLRLVSNIDEETNSVNEKDTKEASDADSYQRKHNAEPINSQIDINPVCILNKNEFLTVKLICEQEYPSVPTKVYDVDGGTSFIEQREQIIAGLETSIDLFMDIVDFLQKSKALLLSIPYIITTWSLESNRNISMLYFDLLGNYIKVLKLFAAVEDRKALVAVYVTAIRVGDDYIRDGDKLIPNVENQIANERREKEANFLSVFTRKKKSEKITKSNKEESTTDTVAAVEDVAPKDGREYWSYSTRILQLITISENLPSHFIHNFAPISSLNRMKPMLLQFLPSLLFVDNVERLRSWGTLNPLNSINEMGNPSIMQKMPLAESNYDNFSGDKLTKLSAHYEILYSDKYCEYIVYGFLVCPHLMCDKETYALYRLVCSRRLFIRLFRELSINIHQEFSHYETEYLSTTEKIPTKLDNYIDIPRKINVTKAIKDVAKNATKNCGHLQRHRRAYIHSELRIMLGIIATMPTLLGPMVSQLIAIAGVAKIELLDYLRHSDTSENSIRKDCRKYFDQNQYKCNDVISLLYDLQCAIDLIIKHSTDIIKPYYVEFLIKNDLVDLNRLNGRAGISDLPRAVRAYLDNFISELTMITEDQVILDNETMKLEQMRLNLDRITGIISSTTTEYRHELITSFTDIMFSLSERSYYIDSLDLLVQEFCEPHEVWWYNSQLIDLYKNSLSDSTTDSSSHFTSVFTVIRASLSNIHPDCPSEELLLGKTALGICDNLLQKLGVHVLLQFKQLWLIFQGLDNQLQSVEAAKRLTRMIYSKMKQQDEEGLRPSNVVLTAELLPGSESEYWANDSIMNIITMINNLSRTLAAISSYGTFTIYNREYSPHIFVKDLIVTFLDSQLELFFINDTKRTVAGGVVLNRPSSCIRQFLNGLNTALFLTSFMNVDILNDMRNLLFDAMIEMKVAPPGTPVTINEIPMPHMRNTLIWRIASYFCDLVPLLASNLGGTLWIPSKNSFTTIVSQDAILGELDQMADNTGTDLNISTLPVDMIINSNELLALMSFIGTQGLKVIEARIIEYISIELLIIFSTIELNEDVLRTITFHHHDSNFDTSIIKLVGMDKLHSSLINIGVALALRDTLRNSLGNSLHKMIPSLHAVVKAALDGINPLENLNFALNVSALAHDAGVPQSYDLSLFHALKGTIDEEVKHKGIDLDLITAAVTHSLTHSITHSLTHSLTHSGCLHIFV